MFRDWASHARICCPAGLRIEISVGYSGNRASADTDGLGQVRLPQDLEKVLRRWGVVSAH